MWPTADLHWRMRISRRRPKLWWLYMMSHWRRWSGGWHSPCLKGNFGGGGVKTKVNPGLLMFVITHGASFTLSGIWGTIQGDVCFWFIIFKKMGGIKPWKSGQIFLQHVIPPWFVYCPMEVSRKNKGTPHVNMNKMYGMKNTPAERRAS